MKGQCMCGAVQIEVAEYVHAVSACHCDICRRWSGAAMFGFDAPGDAVTVTGKVATYRSSEFAERAFCLACGTHLWIRDDGASYDLSPGVFDAARDLPLTREVYADRAFASVQLAGKHQRVTREAYEREHPFVNMEVSDDQV